MNNSPASIAIVGSGPSGCYTAQFLHKKWPTAEIVIFEALPAPYGLVRYGVAADHQGSKAVIEQFDRLLSKGGVHLRANVTVGKDISFQKIRDAFDITVLATGLNFDTPPPFPKPTGSKVIGAGTLLKYLNGHPKAYNLCTGNQKLGSDVAIIGMGNVAIDVARLIAKRDDMLSGSDIDDRARDTVGTRGVRKITLINRSAAAEAKCDVSMLAELLALSNVNTTVIGLTPDDSGPIPELLRRYSHPNKSTDSHTIDLTILLNSCPTELDFIDGRNCLTLARSHVQEVTFISCSTVITAIGFCNAPTADNAIPSPTFEGIGLYRVGWLSRGAKGTVAENRKDAKFLCDHIIKDVETGAVQLGKSGLTSIAHDIPATYVDYAAWKRIDAYEIKSAAPNRCRNKVKDVIQMLRIAHGLKRLAQ